MPQVTDVLVALPVPIISRYREQLQAAAPGVRFRFRELKEVTGDDVEKVQVVMGNIGQETLSKALNLHWVQLTTAGADTYIKEGVLPRDVLLTSATGVYGPPIAEHMLGMLLMMLKQLHHYRDNQHKAIWERNAPYVMLEGARVLVLGLGDLGGNFARRAKALGAYTIGVRRNVGKRPDYMDEIHGMEALDDLLPQVDVVALCLPNTPQTTGVMGPERLKRMKRNSYFINMGRGNAVHTDTLVELLQSGHLAGAGLDVTEPEPLPPEHPLWRCSNAVITPHCSGGSRQTETVDRIIDLLADNLKRYLADEPLRSVVDRSAGY